MNTTDATKLSGFEQVDKQLARFPMLVRGKLLSSAMRKATTAINARIKREAPQEGQAKGGYQYTPRRGERARRPRLAQSIGARQKNYSGGAVIVAVGGPVKAKVGRHAHLVEKGFHHTTGGTFFTGAGRKRKARRGDAFSGAGVRGAFIKPRPYVEPSFEAMKQQVNGMIVDELAKLPSEVKHGN